jgi:hypothetical protein
MYHENKTNDVTRALLSYSISYYAAFVALWPSVFGKECMKRPAERKMRSFFCLLDFMDIDIYLENTTQALMACISLSEFEV